MICIDNLAVEYIYRQKKVLALDDISVSINKGEFICIIGPSGCGKSTLLHSIAGFVKPSKGQIFHNGEPISKCKLSTGIVFQKFSLFMWLSVKENIEFGLHRSNFSCKEQDTILNYYLQQTGLSEFSDSLPGSLSVGMQQRVALARAFAIDPDILLMDEPFASLDTQTSLRMRALLINIWQRNSKTVLFVTHDIDEALFLADRIIVLSQRPGKITHDLKINLPRNHGYEMQLSNEFLEIKAFLVQCLKA